MKIVVGVPGCWVDRESLARALNSRRAYKFDGAKLRETSTGGSFEVEIYDRDPRLAQAFAAASVSRPLPAADLEAIERHTFTVYLLGGPGRDGARRMLKAVASVLDCGGLAAKVETSGLAHSADRWRELAAAQDDPAALYAGFVALVGGPGDVFSCGMHNLAEPDAIVSDAVERPGDLLQGFLLHVLADRPRLAEGQAYAPSPEAAFHLKFAACRTYPPGDLFHNPHGMWRLVPPGSPARRLDS